MFRQKLAKPLEYVIDVVKSFLIRQFLDELKDGPLW